jgi:ribonuclease E
MGKISRFGLMELSRQRLRPSLGETAHIPCPRCHGTGHIRGTESTALHILRIVQEEAMKENTGAINAQVPVDVATFLLNEKRVDLQLIEARHRVSIMLIPNVHLETPNYSVTRMRHDDLNKTEPLPASYNLVEAPTEEQKLGAGTAEPAAPRPEAAVKAIPPQQPAPVPVAREVRTEQPQSPAAPSEQASIIGKIFGLFRRKGVAPAPAPAPEAPQPAVSHGPRRGRHERGDREGPRRDREDRGMQQGGQRQRQPQAQQPHGQRDGGRHRGEQQRHEQRRQEPHRQEQQQRPHPQRDQAQAEVRPASHPQQPGREHGEQQREGRGRRRRRGGRDRYDQRQQDTGGGRGQQQMNRPEGERAAPIARDSSAAPVAAAAPAGIAAPAVESPELNAPMPAYEREVVREFEPRAPEAPRPLPSGPGYAPAEPVRIEWPADLVQVESDPGKIQSVQQRESEQQPAPRPRRVRPPAQPVIEEPLVQIETGQAGGSPADSEQTGKAPVLPG